MNGRALESNLWPLAGDLRLERVLWTHQKKITWSYFLVMSGGVSCIYEGSFTHLSKTSWYSSRYPNRFVSHGQILIESEDWRVTGDILQAPEDIWRMPGGHLVPFPRTV